MTPDWSAFHSLQDTLDHCRLHSRSPCRAPRCSLQLASPLPSRSARPAEGRGRRTSLPVVFGSLVWTWAAQSPERDAASFCVVPGAYGQHTPRYSPPACFSCSIVTSEGGKFFSAVLSSSLWFVRCDCRGRGAQRRRVGSAQWLLPGVLFLFFNSVAQLCPTLCNPMNHSTPGLPVHHQLPEFTQTHVHRVVDAIQPSHPLSSPSPPAPSLSQHQSFYS